MDALVVAAPPVPSSSLPQFSDRERSGRVLDSRPKGLIGVTALWSLIKTHLS